MKRLKATVVDSHGKRLTLEREAQSSSSLVAELKAEGCLVLSIVEMRGAKSEECGLDSLPKLHPSWLKRVKNFDVETGLRQLASMIKSGVTLLFALRTVADQATRPRAAQAWRRVAERVYAGSTFADALNADKRSFGEMTVRLAEVGERSGELEFALSRAADQLEARRNLRTAVINALAYPVFAVAMALAVSTYLVIGVIPKISDFLRSSGVGLPGVTQTLMDVSDWLIANGVSVLVGISIAVGAWMALRFSALGREAEDALLMRLPITGRILRLSGTALFARSMEIMLAAGVTLLDSLETSSRLLPNARLCHRIAAARDAVIAGLSLEKSLAPAVEFMPMLRRMAAVGEVTGSLPEAFGETARFHETMLSITVKRFGMVIEPLMIVITAGIVGFVYVAFFMALFAIAGAA